MITIILGAIGLVFGIYMAVILAIYIGKILGVLD
jgi:hypothetical protein